MNERTEKKVYVIGHRNPDTDSICSAIAYTDLKQQLTGENYLACRAGRVNEETQYVLDRFGVDAPKYLVTVRQEVRDMEINRTPGIKSDESIKHAWDLMQRQNTRSVPVLSEGQLEGIISITDIAQSYMDDCDSQVLSDARTKYRSIAETLNGTTICGDPERIFEKGKVTIATSSPDLMEEFIEEDDLVILGNRYETHFCAIELGASCLVMCQGTEPTKTIRKLASERNCTIISTPYDTFTVARLINQSIPVRYFMTAEQLLTFQLTDPVEEVQEIMSQNRFHNFPVIDKKGMYAGLVSRRRLLNMNKKQVILVDHNEITQAIDGIEQADVLEIIDHHRLGGFETMGPVYFRNQPVGCTATIVTQMYEEAGIEPSPAIAGLLASAIISDTLMFRSPTCTAVDQATCEKLAGLADIDIKELASAMFQAGSSLQNKTPEEICFQDFKKFSIEETEFGVGQINSMNDAELEAIKKTAAPYLDTILEKQNLDMVFLMLTNIIEGRTELLCCGPGSRDLVMESFSLPEDIGDIQLSGVVSRKKQLIPSLAETLRQ